MEKKLPCKYVNLPRELLESPAWYELTANSIRVLIIFYAKRRMSKKPKGRQPKRGYQQTVTNNGQITFPYGEAKKYGITQATFKNTIDQLIKVGFIDVNIPGCYPLRATTYSISERWQKYGTSEFINIIRKRRELKGKSKEEFLKRMCKKVNLLQ